MLHSYCMIRFIVSRTPPIVASSTELSKVALSGVATIYMEPEVQSKCCISTFHIKITLVNVFNIIEIAPNANFGELWSVPLGFDSWTPYLHKSDAIPQSIFQPHKFQSTNWRLQFMGFFFDINYSPLLFFFEYTLSFSFAMFSSNTSAYVLEWWFITCA